MKAEAYVKAAVIERLIGTGAVNGDAVLISEMAVGDWTRRADIVLANGKLVGFEIKSEADSLSRLQGQLSAFSSIFELFYVVAAARFTDRAEQMIPDGIGLWIAEGGQHVTLCERKRARFHKLDVDAALSLMTANDIRRLLAANGINGLRDASRRRLEELARPLPIKDLTSAARESVKVRYRGRHMRFISERESRGTLGALTALQHVRPAREKAPEQWPSAVLPEVSIACHHPLFLQAPAGPVLRRLVKR